MEGAERRVMRSVVNLRIIQLNGLRRSWVNALTNESIANAEDVERTEARRIGYAKSGEGKVTTPA